jgi:hypothetical protein
LAVFSCSLYEIETADSETRDSLNFRFVVVCSSAKIVDHPEAVLKEVNNGRH